ncbi:MAG: hypothetical protein ACREQ5_35370 [Candidatus Dormibacteria bacterium]
MKIRSKFYAALPFLALYIGAASCAIAASGIEVTQKPQEISGIDRDSGVSFQALMPSNDRVIIDTSVGSKQVHAEIDYKLRKIVIRSLSKTTGSLEAISPQDIVAFQKLRTALPLAINIETRHGDALTSLVNLMASAPPVAINYSNSNGPFIPICNEIGGLGEATYVIRGNTHQDTVGIIPLT